jgi:hypothetical protein
MLLQLFCADFRWEAFCACWTPHPKQSVTLFHPEEQGSERHVPLKNVAPVPILIERSVSVLWLSETAHASHVKSGVDEVGWVHGYLRDTVYILIDSPLSLDVAVQATKALVCPSPNLFEIDGKGRQRAFLHRGGNGCSKSNGSISSSMKL